MGNATVASETRRWSPTLGAGYRRRNGSGTSRWFSDRLHVLWVGLVIHASSIWTSGMSSPSSQMMGSAVSLAWSCQVQLGVSTRSPGEHGDTVSVDRGGTALAVDHETQRRGCMTMGAGRLARHDYLQAGEHGVGRGHAIEALGSASISTRRSASAVPIRSPARSACGCRSRHRQRKGRACSWARPPAPLPVPARGRRAKVAQVVIEAVQGFRRCSRT